jgi:integrase
MVNGQRIRETFKNREEAATRAEQIRMMFKNEGDAAFTLPPNIRAEAAHCVELLKPHGATITEAATYYLKHVLAYRTAPTVGEIVRRMLDDAATANRRPRTIRDLRERLGRFAKTFGERQLSSITFEELKAWLDNPMQSARTRVNHATKASQLYNYAIRHGWVEQNLADRYQRPTIEDGEPSIFSVEQATTLLAHAATYDLLPFVAIGLFAGLRTAELQRLDWSAVKLAERSIIIGSDVAKKRSRRVVEINDTLAAWLAVCSKKSGAVVGPNYEKHHRALVKAAGLERWPANALRHSFGSYHLAAHGDAVKTAFQMGNSAVIVHNHYKGLVSNSDVERYWALRPSDTANVVAFQQPAADATAKRKGQS